MLVAGLLALLPLAGLYGFGSDAIHDASVAHQSLAHYLFSKDGKVHAVLLLYFVLAEVFLAPVIAWSAKNMSTKLQLPWVVSKSATLAAYLLLPFGILPSKFLLQLLGSVGERRDALPLRKP